MFTGNNTTKYNYSCKSKEEKEMILTSPTTNTHMRKRGALAEASGQYR